MSESEILGHRNILQGQGSGMAICHIQGYYVKIKQFENAKLRFYPGFYEGASQPNSSML